MKQLLSSIAVLIAGFAFAQLPSVPSKMQLADMKLIITDGAKKDIEKDIKMLRSSDKFFKIKLDRVALYMPVIERIFKEEGVPGDLKYLAIQESALISDAVSSSKAVGFWQFKDFTAREVGMRVDKKIDERKNIVSATYGAARYFKNHQKHLDNWAHTVTAHMTGLGGIKKYTSPKDHGSKKMVITPKSHWYLKRFLAHKIAFQNELDHRNSEGLSIVEYKKGGGKDLDKIAKEFKVEKALLQHYNKWLLHGKIPTDKRYTVVVPVKKNVGRARNLAKESIPPKKTSRPVASVAPPPRQTPLKLPSEIKPGLNGDQPEYVEINGVKAVVVRAGDSFNAILRRTGMSREKFLKFNELSAPPTPDAGETYFVAKKKSKSRLGQHITAEGEGLWSIAHRYGIRKKKLAAMNRMSIIDDPIPGQVMWLSKKRPANIPKNVIEGTPAIDDVEIEQTEVVADKPAARDMSPPTEAPEVEPEKPTKQAPQPVPSGAQYHRVREGETLWAISRRYDLSVENLRMWNNLTKYDPIKPGQKLALGKIEMEVTNTISSKPTTSYLVKPGDTLYQIAKSHDMEVSELIELNNKKNSDIDIGEELKVFKKGG